MTGASRVCSEPGCPEITEKGSRCPAHTRYSKGRGSTYQWRKTRDRILRRDGYRCTYTDEDGNRCPERDRLHVDHVFPVSLGGGDEPENLRVLCQAHNLAKGSKT